MYQMSRRYVRLHCVKICGLDISISLGHASPQPAWVCSYEMEVVEAWENDSPCVLRYLNSCSALILRRTLTECPYIIPRNLEQGRCQSDRGESRDRVWLAPWPGRM